MKLIFDKINIRSVLGYVFDTRRHGQTYVHSQIRDHCPGWSGIAGMLDGKAVKVTWTSYGRSLSAGGHKYKAHCRYVDTGKPVLTRDLNKVAPIP
jgi:hypothetical protein